jgi:toxin ParE1/3/4
MARLVVTADAQADMRDILSYLEREAGPRVTADYARRFRTTIERLTDLPEIGPRRPHLGPDTRIGIVWPYVLIYDFIRKDGQVTLLRILHGRRNIQREMLRR